jgi:hypothetical protein
MTARLSIVLSSVILILMSSAGLAEDDQLQKYKDIWAAQRPKVESGIIHYKQWTGSALKIREHDKVRSLFQEVSKDREDYSAIVRDFACKLSEVDVPPNAPFELVLYFKGDKLRYEVRGGIEIFAGGMSIEARPVIVNDPSKRMQITIRDKNAGLSRPVEGFSEFYQLPSAELADRFVVASSRSDSEQLEAVPDKIKQLWSQYTVIVAKSGDVLEMRSGDPKGTCAEQLFWAFKEFDGVRLPQLIFKGTYNEGKLSSASISTIVDASFGVRLDDNIFVQDAKVGDVILDKRNGGQKLVKTENNIEDVTKQ